MTSDQMLMLFLYVLGAAVGGVILYQVWWHMKYKKVRSEVKDDSGIVTDMKYTAPSTHTTYNAATKMNTTSTTPAKHEVYIKFKQMGEQEYNDEELYETVRMDDDVTAQYVEVWRVERENPRIRTFMYFETNSVTSPKGRKVKV